MEFVTVIRRRVLLGVREKNINFSQQTSLVISKRQVNISQNEHS